jgi:hypothetical protein
VKAKKFLKIISLILCLHANNNQKTQQASEIATSELLYPSNVLKTPSKAFINKKKLSKSM